MRTIIIFSLFVALWIGLGIWYEVSMWQECCATPHSWFYCMRVLGGRG
jgi:hypothetical protein